MKHQTNILVLIIMIFLVSDLHAQHQMQRNDMDSISKELVNPISPIWNLNNYIEVSKRAGSVSPEEYWSTKLAFQPVTPIKLKSGLTSMNRPSLPIYFGYAVPQNNANGQFEKIAKVTGIGDLTLMSSVGAMPNTSFGSFMWGIGGSLTLPTATNHALGSGKWSLGPAGMLVGYTNTITFGFVFSQEWSFAGQSDRPDVNEMMLQPLYYAQLGKGWQIGDNPMWMFKWNGSNGGCSGIDCGDHEKAMIPVGLGVFKTTKLFKAPWRFGVTPRYYIKTNAAWGNQWGFNFSITRVVNSPFQ